LDVVEYEESHYSHRESDKKERLDAEAPKKELMFGRRLLDGSDSSPISN